MLKLRKLVLLGILESKDDRHSLHWLFYHLNELISRKSNVLQARMQKVKFKLLQLLSSSRSQFNCANKYSFIYCHIQAIIVLFDYFWNRLTLIFASACDSQPYHSLYSRYFLCCSRSTCSCASWCISEFQDIWTLYYVITRLLCQYTLISTLRGVCH